jgi:iron complex outermembrane receptor protein
MNQKLLFFVLPLSLSALNLGLVDVTAMQSTPESSEPSTLNFADKSKIETHKVDNLSDFTTFIPNLNISGIGGRSNQTFTLRGVSNYVAYESSVALYVDGVALPYSYGYGLLDMNSIASIEFSKGAYGALFGKGAESGVMRITTYSPSKENRAKLSLEAGSYNHKAVSGYISGATPMEYLNYSLAFNKESFDGYSTNSVTGNDFDYQDMYAIHAKLHYKPSDNFDLTLSYSKLKSEDGGSPFKMNSKEDIRSVENEPLEEFANLKSDRLGVVMNYRWGNYALTSSTSYVKQVMDKGDYIDILGGLSLFRGSTIEELTQELKLKRTFEHSDLTLGLFYSKKLNFDYSEEQVLWNLYPVVLRSLNNLEDPDEVKALSAKYNYHIADNLTLTAGVRYQESKRRFDRTLNNFGAAPTQADASNKWKKFLPLVSLSYFMEDQSLLYFTYSKGFRIGGYNYRSDDTLEPYKEQVTTSYEIGYKKSFENGLMLNTTIYYNTIKDMRVVTFSDTFVNFISNAPKAYSYGLELDMRYQKDNLLLYGSLGLNQAKYETLMIDGVDYSGNDVLEVPDATASLGLRYDIRDNLYINASLSYMGRRYYNPQNSAIEEGYSVSNLALGYRHKGWEVELYGKNILDKEYVDFMIPTPSNDYYHFGAPRVVGAKITKSF